MANPEELLEAAEAIRDVRRLPAVQRHQQLENLLQQAEVWARKEYCKVSEMKDDGHHHEADSKQTRNRVGY